VTQAGRLDRLITVQRQQKGQESKYGTKTVEWVPLVYLPGSPLVAERFPAEHKDVMPSRAEGTSQGLVIAKNQARLRIRWRNDMDTSMRYILHGDTDVTYQLISGPAEVLGRKDQIEFMAERIS
jgi:head-tail adaptor